ncbi:MULTISPECIES: hypothetical protein [Streptacidiphilus]|uniref:Transcriptional regulator n=1 Tax=Streptacidiphilus cavernicola TaxID=3342716 RepID=A0ABV6UFP9_9ACTN|nr:hypothetical protein [Streptacidiphilus jeojiense]
MPRLGDFATLDPALPVEQRELAEAVRGLLLRIGLSCQHTGERLLKEAGTEGFLSRPVLSDLANGRRKRAPREAPLRALHSLAANSERTQGMVCSWETLNRLREALSPSLPAEEEPGKPVACPLCGAAASLEQALSERVRPADITASTPARSVVPVPRPEGDRHNTTLPDFIWAPTEDLALYLTAGNLERANGLIRHVGTEVQPSETADAVVSCRDAGLLGAADAIISYAGRRPERDVLHILHALNQRQRRTDADTLLECALLAGTGTF